MKALTPNEYFAMDISGKLDVLEVKIDAASHRVNVDIKCDLLEVEMMLEKIEAYHRKYSRVKSQQGGAK
jgi:hypothetical protein